MPTWLGLKKSKLTLAVWSKRAFSSIITVSIMLTTQQLILLISLSFYNPPLHFSIPSTEAEEISSPDIRILLIKRTLSLIILTLLLLLHLRWSITLILILPPPIREEVPCVSKYLKTLSLLEPISPALNLNGVLVGPDFPPWLSALGGGEVVDLFVGGGDEGCVVRG